MVDTVTDKLRTINLSAKQLKLITKNQGAQWADDLINEFLNYLININTLSGSTDDLIIQVNLNTGNIEINTAGIAANVIDIAANTDAIIVNALGIAQNADDIVINAAATALVASDLSDHELSNSEHGVTGNNIGTLDYPTEAVGGSVLRMALVANAVASTATVVFADIGVAPATYSQVYAQSQTTAINELKLKHNTILTNLNSLITLFNATLANAKTAKQMTP
jgi:hypothetical protein